jgi:hypothetical protein
MQQRKTPQRNSVLSPFCATAAVLRLPAMPNCRLRFPCFLPVMSAAIPPTHCHRHHESAINFVASCPCAFVLRFYHLLLL